jgi:hypothetical protein
MPVSVSDAWRAALSRSEARSAGVEAGPTHHEKGRLVGGQCLKGLRDPGRGGVRRETRRCNDVEGVVVQAAVGDQEVVGLNDGRARHMPVQVTGMFSEVLLHCDHQVWATAEGLFSLMHSGSSHHVCSPFAHEFVADAVATSPAPKRRSPNSSSLGPFCITAADFDPPRCARRFTEITLTVAGHP